MFEPTAMLAILLSPSGNPVETHLRFFCFANLQLSLTWLFREQFPLLAFRIFCRSFPQGQTGSNNRRCFPLPRSASSTESCHTGEMPVPFLPFLQGHWFRP